MTIEKLINFFESNDNIEKVCNLSYKHRYFNIRFVIETGIEKNSGILVYYDNFDNRVYDISRINIIGGHIYEVAPKFII